ncbi:MAG: hypothetical protein UT43_C0038G0003 [Parcubacteria group bacterium GW2011_GWC1_39_29]|uniref:Uncharacterized protein n=1 Tax=Candidatus Yanofskybacteria bacterium GW2011_GWD1_39_16 TaxID=1619030 RepID=A0A837HTP5_9BACT|nr:MAG: hypothetical protein UT35_C0034G0003 [Candidatus Yanofskybacteria bacterium GW2011_GWD1_39_16]KKR13670.1 MAG: hypothetical protein UT43_C0038G0003 [Parcubacteria group bacterium GW2011_GWC1_39_29]
MANKQESNKGKPSSAGRRGQKYKGFFSESANQRFFEGKLRRTLRRNGEAKAREYAGKHAKYGLGRLLDVLLASRSQRAEKEVATDHTSPKQGERVAQPTDDIMTIGLGGAGQGLPPITFGLGGIFAAKGISSADFPAKRRKPRAKKPTKKPVFISPRLEEAKLDSEASLEEVLDGLLSQ